MADGVRGPEDAPRHPPTLIQDRALGQEDRPEPERTSAPLHHDGRPQEDLPGPCHRAGKYSCLSTLSLPTLESHHPPLGLSVRALHPLPHSSPLLPTSPPQGRPGMPLTSRDFGKSWLGWGLDRRTGDRRTGGQENRGILVVCSGLCFLILIQRSPGRRRWRPGFSSWLV